jgi:hypothetical protein
MIRLMCIHAGMRCGGCVGHVKKLLEGQEGVIEVSALMLNKDQVDDKLLPRAPAGLIQGLYSRINAAIRIDSWFYCVS